MVLYFFIIKINCLKKGDLLLVDEACGLPILNGVDLSRSTVYYFNHVMVQIKLKQGYTIEGYHPDHEAPGFHEYSLGKVLK